MNNASPEPKRIKGKIKSIGLSGNGPNSGELTLVIGTPGKGENFYAGIIDEARHPDGIEHGVFGAAQGTQDPGRCPRQNQKSHLGVL
jgi:hypothetical protein